MAIKPNGEEFVVPEVIHDGWSGSDKRKFLDYVKTVTVERKVDLSNLAIFEISTQRMEWLSARQSAIASNIANADTPGYRARDVAPFSSYLDGSRLDMATTSSGHQSINAGRRFAVQMSDRSSGEAKHSGNTVSLEQEMIQAGQVQAEHSLAVSIMKSFHQMLASAVRG